MKYKGDTVERQRVRATKQPKIEVLDKEVFETVNEKTYEPEWEVLFDGEILDPETYL